MSEPAGDPFSRLEAAFVEISGLLERLRRYRPLAGDETELRRNAAILSAEIRVALRGGDDAAASSLEPRAADLLAGARRSLESFLASEDHRALVEAAAVGDAAAATRLVPLVFADVELADPPERIFHPLLGARGSDVLEPEVGLARIREIASAGFAPTPGPGVGADDTIRPIRFFDGAEGLDVAVLLAVEGRNLAVPTFRAGLDERLVYAPRLRLPFRVALRRESPDEWLEARPGGYVAYRDRWLGLLDEASIPFFDI